MVTTTKMISKEQIIAAIRECTEKLGRAPSGRELKEMTGITKQHAQRRFGSFMAALKECGLTRGDKTRPRGMEELFAAWASAARQLGKVPSYMQFEAHTMITSQSLIKRFKRWSLVPMGMLKYLETQKLEGEWGDVAEMVRAMGAPRERGRALRPVPLPMMGLGRDGAAVRAAGWVGGRAAAIAELMRGLQLSERPNYGDPIHHPAMAHAPVNEAGVMILFGAMAHELGFIVLRSQAGFPDVEALWLMENGRWRRVLIELEFQSRNFNTHLHDAKDCDLIVCWEHNWPDCPVPVIELRRLF